MIYKARKGQVSYGEAIGIILNEHHVPAIPGCAENACTYSYPVRYQRVKGLTFQRLCAKDQTLLDLVMEAGKELVREGVKAVAGGCGFLALFQKELANELEVPVFLSTLLQVPWIYAMLGQNEKVGIITANSKALDASLLEKVGADSSVPVHISGLENKQNFAKMVFGKVGILDFDKVQEEVVTSVKEMIKEDPKVRAILLECTLLAPYGAAIQETTGLPVFDFVTMIDYVYSAVVKKTFCGFM